MSFDKKIINEVDRRLQEVRFINPGDSLKESFVVVEEMIKEGIMQKYALAGRSEPCVTSSLSILGTLILS